MLGLHPYIKPPTQHPTMVLLTGANTRILQLAAIDEQIELCRHELAALVAGVDVELAECWSGLHVLLGVVYEELRAQEKSLADTMIDIYRERANLKNAEGSGASKSAIDQIEDRISELYDVKRQKVHEFTPARVDEIDTAAYRKFKRG
jgi:hypothetical protein